MRGRDDPTRRPTHETPKAKRRSGETRLAKGRTWETGETRNLFNAKRRTRETRTGEEACACSTRTSWNLGWEYFLNTALYLVSD